MKKFYQSKTMWIAGAVLVLGAIQQFTQQLQGLIPESIYGYILSGIGLLMGVLRLVTSTPIAAPK